MKVSLIALGCKVNQYENETIAKKLDSLGFEVSLNLEMVDIYILNTCAVTNEAEKKSRQYITKINKQNPNCKIYVIGCGAKANSIQFKDKKNVQFLIGNNHKEKIVDAIVNDYKGDCVEEAEKEYSEFDYIECNNKNLSERVRKYIKIQDGCNNFCTYCAIPYLRGRSRSRKLENIVQEVRDVSKIAKEIIITGINISDYRINGEIALDKVFYAIKDINSRIRLGSLEVNIITKEFLESLKQLKNFAPQFHLSLQSGCNRILKLMNRHYTTQEYIQNVNLIRQYFPDSAITTDLIVGFAKETEEDFKETLSTIEKVKFSSMHIFEYSEKKGTKGILLGKSSSEEIKDRLKRVNDLANNLKKEYENKFIGKTLSVLVEGYENEYSFGFSGNYIKIYIEDKLQENEFYDIELIGYKEDKMIGRVKK